MINDITLHGRIGDRIEYFATVSGNSKIRPYFYEHIEEKEGESLRFFSSGNEFILEPKGIKYKGTGGSVAEYMFGSEQPIEDMVKQDVKNRLLMFGASYGEENDGGKLQFTDNTGGQTSYDELFLEGNAVCNYYFIIDSPYDTGIKERQKEILKQVGKTLKRTPYVGKQNNTGLSHTILEKIDSDSKDTRVYVFRLIDLHNREYSELFRSFYSHEESLSGSKERKLDNLAEELDIGRYQQQRLKIDVVYKNEENKKIIDEYKELLISCSEEEMTPGKQARLKRLRTLSVRNNVPLTIFDTLDELLLEEKKDILEESEEPDYVTRAREILEGLFFEKQSFEETITDTDLEHLLFAKRRASEERNSAFERLLLEMGRICDEKAEETGNIELLENFGYIVTYFDRYDSTHSKINQLSFMDDATLDEDKLRSLLGNKREFNEIREGLFYDLFIEPVIQNKYVSIYGRKKIKALSEGLDKITEDSASLREVCDEIKKINKEEKLYKTVRNAIKASIKNFYSEMGSEEEREILRKEISQELMNENKISGPIPEYLFEKVTMDIRKEGYYLHHLLPTIINKRDYELREDFLKNSGLDRFYIEELEKEYFDHYEVDEEVIAEVREAGG